MKEFTINDFSSGWCPSDDSIAGRKNALLKMDSIELDQNGAVIMSGGTNRSGSAFASAAHSFYSKFLASIRYRYTTLLNGTTYRDNTSIKTGGSTTRTAFCNAFDYVLFFSGDKRCRDNGTTCTDLGQVKATVGPTVVTAGAGLLTGDLEYVQVNVYVSGAYKARSAPSAITRITVTDENVTVTAENPTSPANEVWIFRRGGDLDQLYRVKRLTSSYSTPFTDNLLDVDALAYNIIVNPLATSIISTNITDPILAAIGPINGRVILFTKDSIHFTEANSPESYLPGQSIAYSGNVGGAEIFLWAYKLGNNVTVIGTTLDVYRLDGTFITLPDGTLDVYLRPLGIADPPIGIDAAPYKDNTIVYMSAIGWKAVTSNGETFMDIVFPNLDRLYRGNTCYGYGGVPIYVYPNADAANVIVKYSCCISKGKLWCVVPYIVGGNPNVAFSYRLDVFDFGRKYWRSIPIKPLLIYAEEDSNIMGFFGEDNYIKDIDNQFVKTLDNGPAVNQTVTFLTTFQDDGLARVRKDAFTLKIRAYTGNAALTVTAYGDGDETTAIALGTITTNSLVDSFINVTSLLSTLKNFQIKLSGTLPNFRLTDISLTYEAHPEQTSQLYIARLDLGPFKKRVRVLPFVMDTLGNDVTVTPYVDGVAKTASTANSTFKQTIFHFFGADLTPDIFGIDYGIKFASSGLFELYEILPPDVVQILPIARRYDQVGPDELFKFGKVRKFQFRILAFGGVVIPYALYFEDTSSATGNITVVDGKEGVYEISVPKGVNGTVIRLVLGPTDFNFHRYYAKVQVMISGKDTENAWIDLGAPQAQ